MAPEQALQLLKQAADLANMPLQGHLQIQKAFEVLASIIKKSDPSEEIP